MLSRLGGTNQSLDSVTLADIFPPPDDQLQNMFMILDFFSLNMSERLSESTETSAKHLISLHFVTYTSCTMYIQVVVVVAAIVATTIDNFLKISLKSVRNFSNYFVHQQTDKRWLSHSLFGRCNNYAGQVVRTE